jgi:hypothetical protein
MIRIGEKHIPARQAPRRHRRRPERPQFDLFGAAGKVAPGEPEWKALPEGARREVMTALTRLMRDHGTPTRLQGREARHDD